jgi:hypothetical protein
MSLENDLKNAKTGVEILGEVIKAAGEDPNVKAAGSELGQSALTITKTINNALLPLAAVNFAFDKARAYFSGAFQREISAKTASIPPAEIVEPKASIAGPALQGLAFAHEETNLKEMYLSLIAGAMDRRSASKAHPAFVEIIRQLSAEDANHASHFLRLEGGTSTAEIRLGGHPGGGWTLLYRHLLPLVDGKGQPKEQPGLPAMVDNLARLGLVEVDYSKHLTAVEGGESPYAWVIKRPEYEKLKARETETRKLQVGYGVITRTALGTLFAEAVGLAGAQRP